MNAINKWALPVLFGTAIPMLFLYAISDSATGILNPQTPVKAQHLPLEAPRPSKVKLEHWINPEPEQLASPRPDVFTTRPAQPVEPERPAPEKQAVFTDRNYVPKNPISIVKFEGIAAPKTKQPRRESGVVVGIKEQERISDRCSGWKKGSIERRNCRMQLELDYRN